MDNAKNREIPFNYTSADDGRIVCHLLGEETWYLMERLRFQRRGGGLLRLLLRVAGDLFMVRRNPFVYQDLVDSAPGRQRFFRAVEADLAIVSGQAGDNPDLAGVLNRCRRAVQALAREIRETGRRRRRIRKTAGAIIGRENVFFDPFTLVSHATDATGWRHHLPVAVLRPASESQVPLLLRALAGLGVGIVPRGAGTGLTGGAVPVRPGCVILNTEKLNQIHGIFPQSFEAEDGTRRKARVMRLGAGVITERAMGLAAARGLVFATDPTSAWACTVGGNIAENAGGKTAVLWGTAIDNLLSFCLATADGRHLTIRRLAHPLRRIRPEDTVRFEILDEGGKSIRRITLAGTEIRKKGLGKDITNKALGGVPGIQKEGCDGVITSAEFILHPAYPCKATCCIEFYGPDMDEAGRVIGEISKAFPDQGQEALMALEHFDEEYVRAIDYKAKAAGNATPKAVLLIDMVGHRPKELDQGRTRLARLLSPYPNTHLFFAANEAEATRFWRDRKRLGAIAARTNAFKLNEDIVLPLDALADFAQFVDRLNIEEARYNQKLLIWQWGAYLDRAEPMEDPDWLRAKLPRAKALLRQALSRVELAGKQHLADETHIDELMKDLQVRFRGYGRVQGEIERIHSQIRARRIVIATHMHAGDGNVHVNIPVFSNDRDMMARAHETADAIMAKAVALGGVVSGEHGIGFTKFKYMDPGRIKALTDYRRGIDPDGRINPGKLSDPKVPEQIFTPSFDLLGLEARILRHGSLERLAEKISQCVRCGRCKAGCAVFYPAGNLFFHPRNKNLALAALIEALLYDAQRRLSTRLAPLGHLEEIAAHCTICHKCLPPCPVSIDTGEISVLERALLADLRSKQPAPATRMALAYLDNRSPRTDRLVRKAILKPGVKIQRSLARLAARVPGLERAPARSPLAYLKTALAPLPGPSINDILAPVGENQFCRIRPAGEIRGSVFYFPGCGSERLYAAVALAAVYVLVKSGIQVILPPPLLCCGFPARVNAQTGRWKAQTLRNSIVLSRIRDMLGNLALDACVVTCGTCRQSLEKMGTASILRCRVMDVARFVVDAGFSVKGGSACLYHTPCHDSLDGGGMALLEQCGIPAVASVPHCCGEAGTLALSRPDIAHAMVHRKAAALANAGPARRLLTNCPACLQGLGRHNGPRLRVEHLTQALARGLGGENWQANLGVLAKMCEILTF